MRGFKDLWDWTKVEALGNSVTYKRYMVLGIPTWSWNLRSSTTGRGSSSVHRSSNSCNLTAVELFWKGKEVAAMVNHEWEIAVDIFVLYFYTGWSLSRQRPSLSFRTAVEILGGGNCVPNWLLDSLRQWFTPKWWHTKFSDGSGSQIVCTRSW